MTTRQSFDQIQLFDQIKYKFYQNLGLSLNNIPTRALRETSILYTDGYTDGLNMDRRTDRMIPVCPIYIRFAGV